MEITNKDLQLIYLHDSYYWIRNTSDSTPYVYRSKKLNINDCGFFSNLWKEYMELKEGNCEFIFHKF